MASKNTHVIAYYVGELPFKKSKYLSVARANPKMFRGKVLTKFTAVYAPDYPRIEQAYVDKGISVYRPEGVDVPDYSEPEVDSFEIENEGTVVDTSTEAPTGSSKESSKESSKDEADTPTSSSEAAQDDSSATPTATTPEATEAPTEAPTASDFIISDDPKQDEANWRDLDWNGLRKEASNFTEEPIRNKAHAIEILEAAEAEGKL